MGRLKRVVAVLGFCDPADHSEYIRLVRMAASAGLSLPRVVTVSTQRGGIFRLTSMVTHGGILLVENVPIH